MNQDSTWLFGVYAALLIVVVVFIGVVARIFMRTKAAEARKTKGGRYFRAYQIYLLVILAMIIWQLTKLLGRIRQHREGLSPASQSATPSP